MRMRDLVMCVSDNGSDGEGGGAFCDAGGT